jgi:hypothetical protein
MNGATMAAAGLVPAGGVYNYRALRAWPSVTVGIASRKPTSLLTPPLARIGHRLHRVQRISGPRPRRPRSTHPVLTRCCAAGSSDGFGLICVKTEKRSRLTVTAIAAEST